MYLGLREKLLLLNINPAQVEKGKMTSTITIFSPISGDVTVMNANVGMFMSPSDVILEIINTGDLHVELSVFEKDILKVKEEQKILFTVPEASNENFQGKVHLVGKSIEGNDRTVNVHGHLDQSVKQRLITGMFVEARIVVASKKGLAIPTDALITENNKYYVLLLDNDKNETYSFKKVAVTVGEKTEKTIELLKNNEINTTSKILTKGVFDITN
jgi:cobalt-zinc-cadmium efflux system membrane fusion protein